MSFSITFNNFKKRKRQSSDKLRHGYYGFINKRAMVYIYTSCIVRNDTKRIVGIFLISVETVILLILDDQLRPITLQFFKKLQYFTKEIVDYISSKQWDLFILICQVFSLQVNGDKASRKLIFCLSFSLERCLIAFKYFYNIQTELNEIIIAKAKWKLI